MTMLNKTMMVGVVAILCLPLLATHAFSVDDGPRGPGMMMGHGGGYGYGRDDVETASRFLRHLFKHTREMGLTDDQAGKLRVIQLDLNRARFRGEAEIEIQELELQSLLENDMTELGAIEAKIKLIEELAKDLRFKAIKALREARLLLTPAQRAKWESVHEKLMERMESGVSGPWQGALSSRMKDGEANISWTLYQSGPEVTGRFVCSGGTLKCQTVGGAISGTLIGDAFTGRMVYADGHLCGLAGTFTGLTLHGEYSCNDRLGEDQGTWRMSWEAPGPPRVP